MREIRGTAPKEPGSGERNSKPGKSRTGKGKTAESQAILTGKNPLWQQSETEKCKLA
jgi:hypothetical protein